jgi:hypothetical protein
MSEQYSEPPHAQGPGPQPQYPMQPMQPPPKKKHTVRNVFIVLGVLGVVFIGGCVAIVGKAADDVSKSVDADKDKNAPRDVAAGKAFTIGKHETLAGWTVTKDSVLGGFKVTGKVKNTSDATSTAFIHFKFIDAKGTVLGNVDCNSGDLEPGQTQALNCIPDGTWGKYTKITAEATF